jgi:microcystin-dependent protein
MRRVWPCLLLIIGAFNPHQLNAQQCGVPTGTVVAFAGTQIPSGWLVADGRPLLQANYPQLYNAIGTAHGAGLDEAKTQVGDFNLPDLRGRFIRGVSRSESGAASENDPDALQRAHPIGNSGNDGNRVGSYQADTLASHTHAIVPNPHSHALSNRIIGDVRGGFNQGVAAGSGSGSIYDLGIKATEMSNLNVLAVGGSETRPRNIAMYYIICAR